MDKMQDAALTTHHYLGLEGFSRMDFILTENEVYALEINTHPGLSGTSSLIPQMLEKGNFSPGFFLAQMIEHAISKKKLPTV